MSSNVKVSIRENKKKKVVTQSYTIKFSMAFDKDMDPDVATEYMAQASAILVKKGTLLHGYLTGGEK